MPVACNRRFSPHQELHVLTWRRKAITNAVAARKAGSQKNLQPPPEPANECAEPCAAANCSGRHSLCSYPQTCPRRLSAQAAPPSAVAELGVVRRLRTSPVSNKHQTLLAAVRCDRAVTLLGLPIGFCHAARPKPGPNRVASLPPLGSSCFASWAFTFWRSVRPGAHRLSRASAASLLAGARGILGR